VAAAYPVLLVPTRTHPEVPPVFSVFQVPTKTSLVKPVVNCARMVLSTAISVSLCAAIVLLDDLQTQLAMWNVLCVTVVHSMCCWVRVSVHSVPSVSTLILLVKTIVHPAHKALTIPTISPPLVSIARWPPTTLPPVNRFALLVLKVQQTHSRVWLSALLVLKVTLVIQRDCRLVMLANVVSMPFLLVKVLVNSVFLASMLIYLVKRTVFPAQLVSTRM
jgi:hypothetical protein